MKKILSCVVTLFLLVLSATFGCSSQSTSSDTSFPKVDLEEATKFLGIPVDGSEADMIRSLETKGFKVDSVGFSGRFNGSDVTINIQTNDDKVYRLIIRYTSGLDERQTIKAFNELLSQFERNGKYLPWNRNRSISEEEDINLEMMIYNRNYEAFFFQLPEGIDKDQYESLRIEGQEKAEEIGLMSQNRLVWFAISQDERSRRYSIDIYYENRYNKADGSDL